MSQHFCALGEHVAGSYGQWPRGTVLSYYVERSVPQFSRDDLYDVIKSAFGLWESVADIKSKAVDSPGQARILVTTKQLDGKNGKLAVAELPPPNINPRAQLRLWFDTGEHWVLSKNPPSGRMDILRVATHELGHNLGIAHAPDSVPALMAPFVSSIRKPVEWDIQSAVIRYGEVTQAGGGTVPEIPKDNNNPGGSIVSKILERLLENERLQQVIDKLIAMLIERLVGSLLPQSEMGMITRDTYERLDARERFRLLERLLERLGESGAIDRILDVLIDKLVEVLLGAIDGSLSESQVKAEIEALTKRL